MGFERKDVAVSIAAGLALVGFLWWGFRRRHCADAPYQHSQADSKHLFALLVGIEKYHNYDDLACTRADVKLISGSLEQKGFFVMPRLNCTFREFDRALQEVKDKVAGQHCEVIVFYFAGHAVEASGQNALLCLDSDPRYLQEEHTLYKVFSRLVEWSSKDTKIVAILDCCRSHTPELRPTPTAMLPRHGQFYVMFACGSGQTAEENRCLTGHGVFTQELAKWIDEQCKFNITSESFTVLANAVTKRTYRRQIPELLCRSNERWPTQIRNIPRRNKHFAGRRLLLDELASRLEKPGMLCLVATSGLAGVGKSQLLIEFLHSRCRSKRIVWWLNAEEELVLQRGLADLAMRAGIITEAEARHELREAAQKAVHALEEELESWVLVFDNAKEYQLVREWIPAQGGIVLVTSRNPHWDSTIAIPVFSADESVELLKSLLGERADVEGAADVAEMLGHHPLALAQAGGWARETNMGLLKYKELLNRRMERRHLLQSAPESLRHQDYQATIATTVGVAITELSNPFAEALFDVCAIASPDHIPYDLLWSFYGSFVQRRHGTATEAEFSAVLKKVCDHSLITAADCRTYDIHRLVQTVRQDNLLAEAAATGQDVVCCAVATAASLFDFDLLLNLDSAREHPPTDYANLMPHCRCIAHFAREFGVEDSESLVTLQINVAEYLFEVCRDHRHAMQLLKCARQGMASDALKLKATVLFTRFGFWDDSEPPDKLLAQLEEALHDFGLQVQVPDHTYEVHGYNTASILHAYAGRLDEARECLATAESLLTSHTDRRSSLLEASFQEALSILSDHLGDLQKGVEHSRQMYRIRKQLLGENSFLTLHALRSLVCDLADTDPAEGVRLGRELVGCIEKLLGSGHPETANAYRALAQCAYQAEDLSLAQEYSEKAIRLLQPGTEPHSKCRGVQVATEIDVARSHGNRVSEEYLSGAIDDLTLAVRLREEFDPTGITVIKLLSYLAVAQGLAGHQSAARRTADRAIQTVQQKPRPVCRLYALLAMAEVLALEGGQVEAEHWYEEAEKQSMDWPEEHPFRHHVARSRSRIGAMARGGFTGLLPAPWATWSCLGRWHLLPRQPEMLVLPAERR